MRIPYDLDAEVAVLASMLLNNDTIDQATSLLAEEHFYAQAHRTLFTAMVALHHAGSVVDPVTLAAHLKATESFGQTAWERIGGLDKLLALQNAIATTTQLQHYAKLILEQAALRGVVTTAMDLLTQVDVGVADVPQFLTDARSRMVTAAGALAPTGGAVRIAEPLREVFDDVASGKMPEGLVSTQIEALDQSIGGGIWPGLLTVLAGRPGMGKSCFLMNLAINTALAGKRVLYVTLEDVRYMVALRMLARFADIDMQLMTMRRVTGAHLPQLVNAIARIGNQEMWVDDTSGLTAAQIAARVARHREQHGLDLLLIDHLAEVADRPSGNERADLVLANTVRTFRDMAKELHIPVVLAHQLNRKVEDRTDKRPNLADLFGSGMIEGIARAVWFLYRPAYYSGDDSKELQLIIAKTNHGRTGSVQLWADLAHMFIRGWDQFRDGPLGEPTHAAEQRTPWTPRGRPVPGSTDYDTKEY